MVSLSYEEVLNCCASKTFAQRLASHSPFQDEAEVFKISKDIWWTEVRRRMQLQRFGCQMTQPLCVAVVHFWLARGFSSTSKYWWTSNWRGFGQCIQCCGAVDGRANGRWESQAGKVELIALLHCILPCQQQCLFICRSLRIGMPSINNDLVTSFWYLHKENHLVRYYQNCAKGTFVFLFTCVHRYTKDRERTLKRHKLTTW